MARIARGSLGDMVYHVLNRGKGLAQIFHTGEDYQYFVDLMGLACQREPVRVLAYCLMPNHFHLVLWPAKDGGLSHWMQYLLTRQVRRHHRLRGTRGQVWQDRFRAFPIQSDESLFPVLRYVEQNPWRAGLVQAVQAWPWSSARWWRQANAPGFLHQGPVPRLANWQRSVNEMQSQAETEALRKCVNRGRPWGSPAWVARTAERLGLQATLRPRGRPRKDRSATQRTQAKRKRAHQDA